MISAREASTKYGRCAAFFRTAGLLQMVRVIKLRPVCFDEAELETWLKTIDAQALRKINDHLTAYRKKTNEETPALPAPARRRGRPPKSGALYSSTAGSRPAKDHGNRKNHDQEVMP